MVKLTFRQRKSLAKHHPSKFVYPPTRSHPLGRYPIENAAHARNALARVSRFGTPAEKRAVCIAVAKHFPKIHESHCTLHSKHHLTGRKIERF